MSRVIDNITLEIDYHIIEHFSEHLYSSPNKAVEELIVNGYDAGATNVRVFVPPSKYTTNIVVWDNGNAMNVSGLKDLWKIADSPKSSPSLRNIKIGKGIDRKVIGKFGIGKIASYTIGNKISHLCKLRNEFWLVTIDYRELMSKKTGTDASTVFSSPILKFDLYEAKEFVKNSLSLEEAILENYFNEDSWTFALIEDLKEVNMPIGRLKWVLGNGMPLKPDFGVHLNEEQVIPNIYKKDLICEWGFDQKEIREQLRSKWKESLLKNMVTGDLNFGSKKGLDPDDPTTETSYVEFPGLGVVWGKSLLYRKSLHSTTKSDFGRSYGFFIMVRGRLINPDDPQFFLNDPSFSIFYSSQYILHIDGLDKDLLADRERVQESSANKEELIVLQRSVYLALASNLRKIVEVEEDESHPKNRLPIDSPEYFMQPLASLWIKSGDGKELGFDFRNPTIGQQPMGVDEFVSHFSTNEGFKVNSDHPYYKNLSSLLGSSKKGIKVVKEFEVIAVSEKLFEGYLYELGIDVIDIDKIMLWRDQMYRKIAKTDKYNLNQLAENLREASYKKGADFEIAIVDVLNSIGFIAEKDGASGQKDGFVRALCAGETYRFTFEAKATTQNSVANDDAETGAANSHRKSAGAEYAIIVVRKFAGFERIGQELPAIIKECESMEYVSIMEVDALIEIMNVVKKYSYTLDSIKDIFTKIESPFEKLKRITDLGQPFNDLSYQTLLNMIWNYQDKTGDGDSVSAKHIWQVEYKKDFTETSFYAKLEALRTIAYPMVQFNNSAKEVALMQSPENIISMILNKFE